MFLKRLSILMSAATLLACCSDARKQTTESGPTTPQPLPPADPLEACALVTAEEVEAVQGERPTNVKPTVRTQGDIAVSSCLLSLPTAANSINLTVYQPAGATKSATTQRWAELFPPDKLQDTVSASGKPKIAPQRVESLGDEAFWAGDDRIGALYVRKGDRFFMLSVGGAGDRDSKLEKSKRLAQQIVAHL